VEEQLRQGVVAGAVAAVLSGIPSTTHALATGRDPLAATEAAGSLALPGVDDRRLLLAAAVPVHTTVSLFWGVVLARLLPRQRTLLWGVVAGVVIYALDFGTVGRRNRRVRALPQFGQLADHVAYGAVAAFVVGRLRRAR
jgi:hypothetical protein